MTYDEFLQEACAPLDLVWQKYRRRSARRRVDERMRELGLHSYDEYLDKLRVDPEEAGGLAGLMRVTVTRFFREGECWEELAGLVLPRLLETGDGLRLRAWSVGCCAGEEPYSLSLLWLGLPREGAGGQALEVLATDIDTSALEQAQRATYRDSCLREVPADLRAAWFAAEGPDRLRLDPRVALPIRFRHHDFMTDPSPEVSAPFDLVLCRYLFFTYYQGARRAEAVARLAAIVRPGGALMVGAKETLSLAEEELFAPWAGTRAVYRRTDQAHHHWAALAGPGAGATGARPQPPAYPGARTSPVR